MTSLTEETPKRRRLTPAERAARIRQRVLARSGPSNPVLGASSTKITPSSPSNNMITAANTPIMKEETVVAPTTDDVRDILRARRKITQYNGICKFIRTLFSLILAFIWTFDIYQIIYTYIHNSNDVYIPSVYEPLWSFIIMEILVGSTAYIMKRPYENKVIEITSKTGANDSVDTSFDRVLKMMDKMSSILPSHVSNTIKHIGSIISIFMYMSTVIDDLCVFVFSMVIIVLTRATSMGIITY